MDAGFIKYLAEQRGFQPGDTIATRQQYDAMYKQYLNDTSAAGTFTPKTGMATNEATGDVTPYFMNSANSAQTLPEGQFKEGPVDKDGTQLVFDPVKGDYFPATNRATKAPVKPDKRKSGNDMDVMLMSPEQRQMYLDRVARGEDPAAGMTPSPTPTPGPGMTNSMAFQGVPARAAYETNMPTGVAAPNMDGAMGGNQGISMAPAATAAAPTNAPAASAVFSAAQYKQMTGQDLSPGDYSDARGRPFSIR